MQQTAYELRISDWSSDVCSSDLHIVLPAAILGYFSLAYISRMTRSFMLEQLSQEYITTARVKGVKEWRVIWVHALGNVWVPLVTVIALSYTNLDRKSTRLNSSH